MLSNKTTLTFLACLLYLTTLGQFKLDAGYIVANDGNKTEYPIENKDRLYTPNSIQYKLSDGDQHSLSTVTTIKEYGMCMGDAPEPVARHSKNHSTQDLLNVRVTPGVSYSSLSVTSSTSNTRDVDFDNDFFFRGGLEIEYIFRFNKNKWSVFFEPTYQYFKGSEVYEGWLTATINYHTIEFPLGLRYHIFLKNESKLFINAIYLPGASKKLSEAEITYGSKRIPQTFAVEIKTVDSFSFGGGYAKGPWSLEARYYIPQNLFTTFNYNEAPYQRLTLIAGFKFLKLKSKSKD